MDISLCEKFFVVNSNYKDYKVSDPRGSDHLKETMNNLFDIFGVINSNFGRTGFLSIRSSISRSLISDSDTFPRAMSDIFGKVRIAILNFFKPSIIFFL